MSGDNRSVSNIALEAVDAAWRVVPNKLRDLVDAGKARDSTDGATDAQRTDAQRSATGADGGGVTDLANDLASVLVRFTTHLATQIAKEVVNAAGEVGSVVSKHPTVGAIAEPFRAATRVATEPAPSVLVLPDASPGQTTSVPLVIRNDSLDNFDGVRLRCFVLLGPEGRSIPGANMSFSPPSVDVAPNSTETVTCQVTVPPDAKRAQYQGLIDAIGIGGVQLMVSLDVI